MNDTAREDADERQRLAVDLAYNRGREKGLVDSRLDQHEARLNAINGSLMKVATRIEAFAYTLTQIEQAQGSRDAVATALQQSVDRASASQVTTRTFVLGLCGFLVALSAVLVGVLS